MFTWCTMMKTLGNGRAFRESQTEGEKDLKVINKWKIRKEGKNVFNLQQSICLLQKCNRFSNVFSFCGLSLLDNMLGYHEPELLPQLFIVLHLVSLQLCSFWIHLQICGSMGKSWHSRLQQLGSIYGQLHGTHSEHWDGLDHEGKRIRMTISKEVWVYYLKR